MRISDGSSDVCSADLAGESAGRRLHSSRRGPVGRSAGIEVRGHRCREIAPADDPRQDRQPQDHDRQDHTEQQPPRAFSHVHPPTSSMSFLSSVLVRPWRAASAFSSRASSSSRARVSPAARSEEHTSELQSLMRISYAVFCLKKKKKHKIADTYSAHRTTKVR